MPGFGFDFEARGRRRSAYASYSVALDFKNADYWYGGTKYALSAVPGYVYTDAVDNTPNVGASGYSNDTSSAFRVNTPITTEQDFVLYVVVNFSAATDATNQWAAAISDGTINHIFANYRAAGGQAAAYSQGVTEFTGVVVTTGRTVILLRRRAGKNTGAVKVAGGTVTVGTEGGAVAFPTGLARLGIASYDGAGTGALPVGHFIEGVFIRTGTFDDAALTSLLAAA